MDYKAKGSTLTKAADTLEQHLTSKRKSGIALKFEAREAIRQALSGTEIDNITREIQREVVPLCEHFDMSEVRNLADTIYSGRDALLEKYATKALIDIMEF